jgi:hypothetical protein
MRIPAPRFAGRRQRADLTRRSGGCGAGKSERTTLIAAPTLRGKSRDAAQPERGCLIDRWQHRTALACRRAVTFQQSLSL